MRSRAFVLCDHIGNATEQPLDIYQLLNSFSLDVMAKNLQDDDTIDYQTITKNAYTDAVKIYYYEKPLIILFSCELM